MENKNQKAYKIIKNLIATNKNKVLISLNKSFINVDRNISDNDLFNLITSKVIEGNGYLIFNLGKLIDSVYETEPTEVKSNGTGLADWFSNSNNQKLVGMGVGLLGNLFGKGGDSSPPPSNNANSQMMMQYQMAQQQAAAQARREEERRRAEAAKRSQNMMIFGGVGAVLLIGVVIFVVSKNN